MEQEQLEQLARRVWAERKIAAERAKRMRIPPPPWYMLNLGHPAIRALYDQWQAGKGWHRGDAPGDIERTCFELELLGEEARREIETYLDRLDQFREGAAAAEQEKGAENA